MTLAICSTYGTDRYAAGEGDATFGTVRALRGDEPGLLWFHGNNQTALTDRINYRTELRLLAQSHHVVAADTSGNSFGNDDGITQAIAAADHYGLTTFVAFGVSMGAALALNLARLHPSRVSAVVGIIPALDLNVDGAHPAADEIDAAYPPAYDPGDPTHTAHSPVTFAATLSATLPIGLWTSSTDTTCPPATADAFVAARPQTHRTVFGAYGHGGISVAVPLAAAWLTTVH